MSAFSAGALPPGPAEAVSNYPLGAVISGKARARGAGASSTRVSAAFAKACLLPTMCLAMPHALKSCWIALGIRRGSQTRDQFEVGRLEVGQLERSQLGRCRSKTSRQLLKKGTAIPTVAAEAGAAEDVEQQP
jgi:hypothetical protein